MLNLVIQTRQKTQHWLSAHTNTFPPAFLVSHEHGFRAALAGYRNNKATGRLQENLAALTSRKYSLI